MARIDSILNWPISDWLGPITTQSRNTRMKLLRCGIEHHKYFWGQKFTTQLLIYGRSDVYFMKSHTKEFFSVEILKSTRSLKSSKSWELLIKTYGEMSVNSKTSNPLSLNGKEDNLMNSVQRYQTKVLTC